jgi:yeast amino acid transporter
MRVVIIGLNFMPVRFCGETEFGFAGTKVILPVGLLTLSFIVSFHYWKDLGAANAYIVGGNTGVLGDDGALGLSIHVRARIISRHG